MQQAGESSLQEETGRAAIYAENVSTGSKCDRCGTSPWTSATNSRWTAFGFATPFNSSSTIKWYSPSTSKPIQNSLAKPHSKSSISPLRPSPMSVLWSSWIITQAHRCGAVPTTTGTVFGGAINFQSINFSKAASSSLKDTKTILLSSAWISEISWERLTVWKQRGGTVIRWLTGSEQPR